MGKSRLTRPLLGPPRPRSSSDPLATTDPSVFLPPSTANSTTASELLHPCTRNPHAHEPGHRGCHSNGHFKRSSEPGSPKRHSHTAIRRKREYPEVVVVRAYGALLPYFDYSNSPSPPPFPFALPAHVTRPAHADSYRTEYAGKI